MCLPHVDMQWWIFGRSTHIHSGAQECLKITNRGWEVAAPGRGQAVATSSGAATSRVFLLVWLPARYDPSSTITFKKQNHPPPSRQTFLSPQLQSTSQLPQQHPELSSYRYCSARSSSQRRHVESVRHSFPRLQSPSPNP